MSHLKSAAKNLRKSRRRAQANLKIKAALKKLQRGPVTARTLPILTKSIDKAAKRKILTKARAARLKSRLSKKIR